MQAQGEIYRTTDGGKTWTSQNADGNNFAKVNFINNKLGFAVGYGGEIHRTITGGITSVLEKKKNLMFLIILFFIRTILIHSILLQ